MNQNEHEFNRYLISLIEDCSPQIINPYRNIHYLNYSNEFIMGYNPNYNQITFENNIWFKLKYKAYLFGLIKDEKDLCNLIKKLLEKFFNCKLYIIKYGFCKRNKSPTNSILTSYRCDGNSTRQIDNTIQFNYYLMVIELK